MSAREKCFNPSEDGGEDPVKREEKQWSVGYVRVDAEEVFI